MLLAISDQFQKKRDYEFKKAIDELGYRPNPVAKRLASGEQGRNIGFVLPFVAPEMTGVEMKFIAGAARIINQADYNFILLAHPDRNPDILLRNLHKVVWWMASFC